MKKLYLLVVIMLTVVTSISAEAISFRLLSGDNDDLITPFKTELSIADNNDYVIANFLATGQPLRFTIGDIEPGSENVKDAITLTGDNINIKNGFMYFNDEYAICELTSYDGDWFDIYMPHILVSSLSLSRSNNMDTEYEYTFSASLYDEYDRSFTVIFSFNANGDNSGITSISSDSQYPTEYYTLDGIRVNAPQKGLLIKRQGNKVQKIIIK